MNIHEYLKEKTNYIDRTLTGIIRDSNEFHKNLYKAMQYSVFAGGKRIRPVLLIAAAESVGGRMEDVIDAACTVELIHTYSLIHDDLPAMDDDDLRRGKVTNHKVFGEALAILAGDALLTLAFDIMARDSRNDPEKMLKVIHEIAKASGADGMVGGQAVDIEYGGRECELPVLEYIHTHKTGALILASIRAGAILSDASNYQIESLTRYGGAVGLAFQIVDDILNVEGSQEIMGKNTGSDVKKGKATYPKVVGLKESKERVKELTLIAMNAIKDFDDKAEPLRAIARYVIDRKR